MPRRKQNSSPMSLFSFQDIITATTGILILLALVLALSVIVQNDNSVGEPEIADEETIGLRDDLIGEVKQLNHQSMQITNDAATWSSSTPAELQKKIDANLVKQKHLLADIAAGEKRLSVFEADFKKLDPILKLQTLSKQLNEISESSMEISNQIQKLKASDRVVYNFREANRSAWLVEVKGNCILSAKIDEATQPRKFVSARHFNKFAASLPESQQYFILVVKPSGIVNYNVIKPYLMQINADIGTELVGEKQTAVHPIRGAGF